MLAAVSLLLGLCAGAAMHRSDFRGVITEPYRPGVLAAALQTATGGDAPAPPP